MSAPLNNVIEFMNRWGEIHWNFAAAMFLQASVLIVVLLCLDFAILRRLRASIRYSLWMLVLVKLMLPVSLHTPLSLSRWMPVLRPQVEVAETPRSEPVVAVVSHPPREPVPAPIEPVRGPGDPPSPEKPHPSVAENRPDVAVGEKPSPAPIISAKPEVPPTSRAAAAAIPSMHLNWKAYVFLTWMTAVLILIVLFVRRTWMVRRIVAVSSAAPEELEQTLSECLQLTNVLGKRVRLRVSDDLGSPAICGFWRGTILLPRTLLQKLNRRQLRSILVHELVHWRRFDLQVNCLQTLLLIVYFYNPLVWVANVILRRAREQAVDEAVLATLDAPAEDYSTTLLDIASLSRRPAELTLRLVGVVESRKALSGRIKRILSRPIPRTARLGIAGLVVVLITGFVLLPMGGTNEPAAIAQNKPAKVNEEQQDSDKTQTPPVKNAEEDKPAVEDRAAKLAREEKAEEAKAAQSQIVLIGQLKDEKDNPVTDAEVKVSPVKGGSRFRSKTDEHGFYVIDNFKEAGRYRLEISSKRWVGVSYRDRVEVTLQSGVPNTRNFTLKRACSIRIRTVDEQGKPVRGVRVMANNLAAKDYIAPDSVRTDAEGWVTVGGLAPSKTEYLIAAWPKNYAFERLVVTLDDPEQVPEKEIVLRQGKTIKGMAVCSDGKPPAGWRILAMPSWWHFGTSPRGATVAEDGSFTLSHIVPGKYDVRFSIPHEDGSSSVRPVLNQAELADTKGVLKLKIDYPSPASMVYITGHVKLTGKPKGRGFWIFANSSDDRRFNGSTYWQDGKTDFKIGPVPKGTYELKVENVGMKAKPVTVTAPAKDVELVVQGIGQPKLTGRVIDAKTKAPITRYRLRVYKQRTLSGPSFAQEPRWREFKNDKGQFEYEVHGPGVYNVQVAAEGYAWQFSDEINTDKDAGKPVQIALSNGVSLTGIVVDQAGNPIEGAIVMPLSKAEDVFRAMSDRSINKEGAVKTVNGEFEIPHLVPGKEMLKVVHPDYCLLTQSVDIGPSGNESLRLALTQGGAVRGRVYDAAGNPEPNVTLKFHDDRTYRGNRDEGGLATVVTDADGYYEVHQLPEELCYAYRAGRGGTLGVSLQTVLPANGQTRTLDFGGESRLTGRLLVNGRPLADGDLILSGDSPHFGIFKASARTQSDGSFTFRGIPPGERTLYYAIPGRPGEYGRAVTIDVTPDGNELGAIDHVTGRLDLRVEPVDIAADEKFRLTLQTYDPIWDHGYQTGITSHNRENNSFTIEQVPIGKHELVCSHPDHLTWRRIVEITPDSLQQTLAVQLPVGTAGLSGHYAQEFKNRGYYPAFKLWSQNGRWMGYLRADSDGSYRMQNLPAGEYLIREKATRNAHVIYQVTLQEGERKTLDFSSDMFEPDPVTRGFLSVHPYTSNGVPLPCRPYLEGPDGQVTPHSSQRGRVTFSGKPGTYTLVIDYPGFETIRRSVEMQPVNPEGAPTGDYRINVFLNESD
jgi:beta-lactamase regulating signal transducer with metallopeptidase domain/protocatechuate 3,4-dioxygenase beta subunit